MNKNLPIKNDELKKILKEVTELVPDAFNMKSAKIVVAIGKKQDELWDAIFDAFGGIVAEPDEKPVEDIDARVKFFE